LHKKSLRTDATERFIEELSHDDTIGFFCREIRILESVFWQYITRCTEYESEFSSSLTIGDEESWFDLFYDRLCHLGSWHHEDVDPTEEVESLSGDI
jgi:hypothetical protein